MSGAGVRPTLAGFIPAKPLAVAAVRNVYTSDGKTPSSLTAPYDARDPPPFATRPMSGQLDASLVPRLLQGLAGHVPSNPAALEFPADGESDLVDEVMSSIGHFKPEGAATDSLVELRRTAKRLARTRFEDNTIDLLSPYVSRTYGSTGNRTISVRTTTNGAHNDRAVGVAIEAKAPRVLLQHFHGLGPGPVVLDATRESTGIEAMMIKMSIHIRAIGGRFGLWWSGVFFAFAELVDLPTGGTMLLVSEVMSTFTPAFPLPVFAPPMNASPAAAPVLACLVATIGHALDIVQIPPSALAPGGGGGPPGAGGPPGRGGGPRATARATKSTTTSGPRQTPEGAQAVSLGCSNGFFDVRALVRPASATVKYSDAGLYDVQPRPLTSVRFSVVGQFPTPPRDGPSTLPIQIDEHTEAFLSALPEDKENPGFCPMERVPDCPPSVRIILHERIGDGRTSVVHRAEAIDIETNESIADVPLVAKLVTYEHFFSAAREELFYIEVLPKCPVDVQNLLPRYYGAFMRAAGSWVVMLFEDVGSPIPPGNNDWWDEDLQDDREECRQAHAAFDKLREAGIDHRDRRHPNVGVRDGRVRVFDLGQARLKAPE